MASGSLDIWGVKSKTPTPTIATIVGARPQFIKAATVSRALKEIGLEEVLIHTGQHFDTNMSDIFFEEMSIPKPHYQLGISGLTHGAMTGEMLKRIEEIFLDRKPSAVLVYGDTNSTLAGALAAAKLHIPIAHVEAGLRSFNMKMPEEINRVLTDRVSKWLFCPTETAIKNLNKEGFGASSYVIANVGDVMFDATLFYKQQARWPSQVPTTLKQAPFLLCTLHRQESTDDLEIFKGLIGALQDIAETMPVVWPVHPRAQKLLERENIAPKHLIMIPPVGYMEMLALLDACALVATDSGGLQKEAYFFGKHCLVLRTETEWVELTDLGYNSICGVARSEVLKRFHAAKSLGTRDSSSNMIYGDGKSAYKIANTLKRSLLE